jgi:hypothetical protein
MATSSGGEHTEADASDGAREYARRIDLQHSTGERDREIAAAIDARIGRGRAPREIIPMTRRIAKSEP